MCDAGLVDEDLPRHNAVGAPSAAEGQGTAQAKPEFEDVGVNMFQNRIDLTRVAGQAEYGDASRAGVLEIQHAPRGKVKVDDVYGGNHLQNPFFDEPCTRSGRETQGENV